MPLDLINIHPAHTKKVRLAKGAAPEGPAPGKPPRRRKRPRRAPAANDQPSLPRRRGTLSSYRRVQCGDAHGQSLGYFYVRDNDNDAGTAGVLTMDKAWRLVSNFANLLELLGRCWVSDRAEFFALSVRLSTEISGPGLEHYKPKVAFSFDRCDPLFRFYPWLQEGPR